MSVLSWRTFTQMLSESIHIDRCVRQGDTMSPIIFTAAIEKKVFIKKLNRKTEWNKCGWGVSNRAFVWFGLLCFGLVVVVIVVVVVCLFCLFVCCCYCYYYFLLFFFLKIEKYENGHNPSCNLRLHNFNNKHDNVFQIVETLKVI